MSTATLGRSSATRRIRSRRPVLEATPAVTPKPLPPKLAELVAAWEGGHQTAASLAAHLNSTEGAVRQLMSRGRQLGLLDAAPAPEPELSQRYPTQSLSRFAAGGWIVADEPVWLTRGHEILGIFTPQGRPRLPSRDHLGIPAYEPEATAELELSKIAWEVAKFGAELEAMASTRVPGSRPGGTQRQRLASARRLAWLIRRNAADGEATDG